MRSLKRMTRHCATALLATTACLTATTASETTEDQFLLDGRRVTIIERDILPVVENRYAAVFRYDSFDNPKLAQLRQQERLDAVVSAGTTEFERQSLLLEWAFRRLPKFGRPTAPARGALDIIAAADAGHTFFCAHFSDVLTSAAASMGWICRPLALKPPASIGGTEHSVNEIWSNQYRKWVFFDPTYGLFVEKDGIPLTAWEIRQEWFSDTKGEALTFVLGAGSKRYTRKDLPIQVAQHPGFGNLQYRGANQLALIGYVPNTDLMDSGRDWGRMFITRDAISEDTTWHKRVHPQDPASEPYFPLNQAAIDYAPGDGLALAITLRTMSPNFQTFRIRIDGGEWRDSESAFAWPLRPGRNTLEAMSVNRFGVTGPPSTLVCAVSSDDD